VAQPGELNRPPLVLWAGLDPRERQAVDNALELKAEAWREPDGSRLAINETPKMPVLPLPSLGRTDMYDIEEPSLYDKYRPDMPPWIDRKRLKPPIKFAPPPAPPAEPDDGLYPPRGIPEEDNQAWYI
jgi:hypothetical protein